MGPDRGVIKSIFLPNYHISYIKFERRYHRLFTSRSSETKGDARRWYPKDDRPIDSHSWT
ncbi:hypothetical protein AArcCO_1668 [Halalkaliarchaeum sp. AArc-CO]|nr:hypothetical protein AArcCO_1668 [Halalkaliarchaeum sp. AArc-CO]